MLIKKETKKKFDWDTLINRSRLTLMSCVTVDLVAATMNRKGHNTEQIPSISYYSPVLLHKVKLLVIWSLPQLCFVDLLLSEMLLEVDALDLLPLPVVVPGARVQSHLRHSHAPQLIIHICTLLSHSQ